MFEEKKYGFEYMFENVQSMCDVNVCSCVHTICDMNICSDC